MEKSRGEKIAKNFNKWKKYRKKQLKFVKIEKFRIKKVNNL